MGIHYVDVVTICCYAMLCYICYDLIRWYNRLTTMSMSGSSPFVGVCMNIVIDSICGVCESSRGCMDHGSME